MPERIAFDTYIPFFDVSIITVIVPVSSSNLSISLSVLMSSPSDSSSESLQVMGLGLMGTLSSERYRLETDVIDEIT